MLYVDLACVPFRRCSSGQKRLFQISEVFQMIAHAIVTHQIVSIARAVGRYWDRSVVFEPPLRRDRISYGAIEPSLRSRTFKAYLPGSTVGKCKKRSGSPWPVGTSKLNEGVHHPSCKTTSSTHETPPCARGHIRRRTPLPSIAYTSSTRLGRSRLASPVSPG